MARKYNRDANGRFKGGAGQSNGKAPAGQKRVVAKNGSKSVAAGKVAARKSKGGRLKTAAKSVGTFAKKNPRLVVGVAGLAASQAVGRSRLSRAVKAIAKAQKYAEGQAASKRGIKGKQSAGLRPSKRNMRGAYNIRSS